MEKLSNRYKSVRIHCSHLLFSFYFALGCGQCLLTNCCRFLVSVYAPSFAITYVQFSLLLPETMEILKFATDSIHVQLVPSLCVCMFSDESKTETRQRQFTLETATRSREWKTYSIETASRRDSVSKLPITVFVVVSVSILLCRFSMSATGRRCAGKWLRSKLTAYCYDRLNRLTRFQFSIRPVTYNIFNRYSLE